MHAYEDHRGAFRCRGSDGMTYSIEYIVHVDESTVGGAVATLEGDRELRCGYDTADRIEKGRYRLPDGVELWTDDPAAP